MTETSRQTKRLFRYRQARGRPCSFGRLTDRTTADCCVIKTPVPQLISYSKQSANGKTFTIFTAEASCQCFFWWYARHVRNLTAGRYLFYVVSLLLECAILRNHVRPPHWTETDKAILWML